MPSTTNTRNDPGFASQTEARRAVVDFIWGTGVHITKRSFIAPSNSDVSFYDDRGLPVLAVSANVNGHLVVFHFDHYGRLDGIEYTQ